MKDRIYFDTNIILYSLKEGRKRHITSQLMETNAKNDVFISSQVISEFVNVCLKKQFLSYKEITRFIDLIAKGKDILLIDVPTIKKALQIKERYKLPYYDSQHIAVALENKCNILYSEDMHHNQNIIKVLGKRSIFCGIFYIEHLYFI